MGVCVGTGAVASVDVGTDTSGGVVLVGLCIYFEAIHNIIH